MPGIFISYRHDDSAGFAGRLYGDLCDRLSSEHIFRDIDTLKAGEVFTDAIEQALNECDAFVAVIGRYWLTSVDAKGQCRLQDPRDYVRQEIETALRRHIHVIPVLVQGVTMPEPQDLPESLQPLAERQALPLTDSHWKYDVERLIGILGRGTKEVERVSRPKSPFVIREQENVYYVEESWLTTWVGNRGCTDIHYPPRDCKGHLKLTSEALTFINPNHYFVIKLREIVNVGKGSYKSFSLTSFWGSIPYIELNYRDGREIRTVRLVLGMGAGLTQLREVLCIGVGGPLKKLAEEWIELINGTKDQFN